MKINTAVIGTGLMGLMHAKIYDSLNDCNLVSVCDNNKLQLKKATDILQVKGYTSFEKMISSETNLDAISICTPDIYHLDPAIYAAKNNINILIEKPIDRNVENAKQIIQKSKEFNIKLMVGHLLRFDPSYLQAYNSVISGEIGDILHIYTRRNDIIDDAIRLNGITSLPFYLGVHDYDLIQWFVKDKLQTTYSIANSSVLKKYNVDDSLISVFKFTNGVIASSEISWVLPASIGKSDMSMEIVGTKGVIYIDAYNTGLKIHTSTFTMPDTMYCATGINNRIIGALREQIIHFIECIKFDKTPFVTGENALESVKMAYLVEKSLENNNIIFS